jgi:hypothetical protein
MIRLIAAALLVSMSGSSVAASLTEAQGAYDNNKIPDAQRLFSAVAADPGASPEDRADAAIGLARIEWLVERNAAEALRHLGQASAEPCDISIMKLRVLTEAKRSQDAINAETPALQACGEAAKRDQMRVQAINARLDLAQASSSRRKQIIADAAADARLLTPDAGAEGARARLQIALLTSDAPSALAAWKDYFWLDDADAPQALIRFGASRRFTRGLARGATTADELNLAELLMRAGFGEEARRYANGRGLPASAAGNPIWKRLSAYWTEREKLETEILRVNREFAHGQKDDKALETAAKSAMANLVQATGASGEPKAALLKYYGLLGTVGLTNGYPSIHLGHVVEDRDEQVTQYGHSARIHFMAIDNMISNGFTSWLWDGSAMVGGWQANGTIIQVRPAYLNGPLRAYRLTQDGPERQKLLARQAKRAADDIAALKQHPVATLEGLNDRLLQQAANQVAADVESKARGKEDFRRLFLAEYSRATFNHSIMIHEGRHAIDASLGVSGKDQSILEYDAKLSELALSTYPRMALANIDRTLEGSGPHDIAGARIFDGYRQWMAAHTSEIAGYDPTIPALEQLDKLSDDQIREVARSLDPLAKGAVTASAGSPSGTSTR